jgi:hypothetical protein
MWHFRLRATRKRFALSLLAVGFLAACDEVTSVGPTGPPDHAAVVARRAGQEPSHPGEARFFRLAKIVPGFGGYFFDGDGNVHVYLTDLSRERQIRGILRPLVKRRNGGQPSRRGARVVVRQGRYDFLQLASWRDALFLEGYHILHSIAVAEAENVVRIGAATLSDADVIVALASRLGIPNTGLRIDVSPPDLSLQTLSSLERSHVGGILITSFETGQECAIGYNTNNGTSL